jgi:NAD(P)-dependent dehydrogenase (short-subunit alcohol dehydrogenase family)/pimeloyl-ACP methyl ester carboxylesterase
VTAPDRRVISADGTGIAVYEAGDAARPTIVCIHGYPDNAAVWAGVTDQLADRYHVVRYDVRGAGSSDQPGARAAYALNHLLADFTAVIEATSPNRPVHVVGHDWGSVQAWHFVTEPAMQQQIATFTSISGPSLDHAARWISSGLRPFSGHFRAALHQLRESYYIGLFHIPLLPELLWRSGVLDRAVRVKDEKYRRSTADRVNGLNLYRANIANTQRRIEQPASARHTDIPVQVLAPVKDRFVSPAFQLQSPKPFASNLFLRPIAGGHWIVAKRPEVIANAVTELIERTDAGRSVPELDRARARAERRGSYAGALVLITGAGSGIGRQTAYAFARQGADLVLADINEVSATETAVVARRLGAVATVHQLDVAVAEAWQSFALRIKDEMGVPDVLVNNAGIGMAGPFLSTTQADWDRIIDINLRSVISGSLLFAEQMRAHGHGGQIVNIASAAAYSPSRTYPAYATTKAAVLMLTECLRAELSAFGITVTAICPGFIDTDISRTTTHVGLDAADQAVKQAKAVRSYARRNYSPQRAAAQIVGAAAAGKPIKYITAEALGFRAIDRLLPAAQRAFAKVDLTEL